MTEQELAAAKDAIAEHLLQSLRPYIGRTHVTAQILEIIQEDLVQALADARVRFLPVVHPVAYRHPHDPNQILVRWENEQGQTVPWPQLTVETLP